MSDITITSPSGQPSAADKQQSSYAGVSTADLMVLYRTLVKSPANLSSGAVLMRVRLEFDRRPQKERQAAIDAANTEGL